MLIPSQNSPKLEYQLHKRFASKRKCGEWFNLTRADICDLMSEYENVSNDTPETIPNAFRRRKVGEPGEWKYVWSFRPNAELRRLYEKHKKRFTRTEFLHEAAIGHFGKHETT